VKTSKTQPENGFTVTLCGTDATKAKLTALAGDGGLLNLTVYPDPI
jgi:hypothetical protein